MLAELHPPRKISVATPENWDVVIGKYSEFQQASRVTPLWRDPYGPLVISRLGRPEAAEYRLHLGDDIQVDVLSGNKIVVVARDGLDDTTLGHFLSDQVFPRMLAGSEELVLHAGAVRIGAGAALFIGASGLGKSTLVTSLDQAGSALMGDDAMVITSLDGDHYARPVYPSLRLMPDSIRALLPADIETHPVANYTTKQRVDVPIASARSALATTISAIFLLAVSPDEGQIKLRRLTIANACMAFVQNSFALDPSDTARARDRMEQASALARQVPAFELSYPRDYARLPEVRQAILDQVAALAPA